MVPLKNPNCEIILPAYSLRLDWSGQTHHNMLMYQKNHCGVSWLLKVQFCTSRGDHGDKWEWRVNVVYIYGSGPFPFNRLWVDCGLLLLECCWSVVVFDCSSSIELVSTGALRINHQSLPLPEKVHATEWVISLNDRVGGDKQKGRCGLNASTTPFNQYCQLEHNNLSNLYAIAIKRVSREERTWDPPSPCQKNIQQKGILHPPLADWASRQSRSSRRHVWNFLCLRTKHYLAAKQKANRHPIKQPTQDSWEFISKNKTWE